MKNTHVKRGEHWGRFPSPPRAQKTPPARLGSPKITLHHVGLAVAVLEQGPVG